MPARKRGKNPTIEGINPHTEYNHLDGNYVDKDQAGKPPNNLPTRGGLGHHAYTDKQLSNVFTQPLDAKGKISRNTWADTAYVLVMRAKKASQTYGKKDFNALYRLILSAGIAFDKAWPVQAAIPTGNLIVNMFGSLGADATTKILEPAHPVIDITPISTTTEPDQVSTSTDEVAT